LAAPTSPAARLGDPYGLGHQAPQPVVDAMVASLTLLTGKQPIVLEE
jgi:hypothetical protein